MASIIKLDYDFEKNFAVLCRRLCFLQFLNLIKVELIDVKKTVRGYHVRIYVQQKLDPAVVIALQAVLGSDWKRESLNLERVVNVGKFMNVLHMDRERGLIFRGSFKQFQRRYCQ